MSQFIVKAKQKFGGTVPQDYAVTQNGTIASQAEAEAHVQRHHPYLTVIPLTGSDLEEADAKARAWWATRSPATQENKEDVAPAPQAPSTPIPADSGEVVHPASLAT